ncbi:MAG TPA: HAMP domain-containing sensor histidine kinase, partial [Gemmata sp.]|nr:HAMP domain-containing sensor histidine kinase [Gemmata sp.]
ATVRTTERKTEELQRVDLLLGSLIRLDQLQSDPASEIQIFDTGIEITRSHLKNFTVVNAETVAKGFDPDDGAHEGGLSGQLETSLQQLQTAIRSPGEEDRTATVPLRQKKHVRLHYENARRIAEELRTALIDDIRNGIDQSKRTINRSLWVVRFATFWAIVLTLTLLYYFRVWMFAPIRQLQAGVHRVHGGDFGQPIALESGDELQELADEFNAMTARLAAIYADLARQVNERSRQLVRSERMVSVGFLAAGVAHEINNPLASILFCSEALERRLQDVLAAMTAGANSVSAGDSEVLMRYLKMIQQEALRCKDITQKLLDFSRTGERKRESTDLAALVRGVLEVARHLPNCRGKNITFEPTGYIVAPVNGQDLKSVILNLVVNALDSMEEGGRLAIGLSSNAGNAELTFADTGCGMTPEVLQNIFEPFYTRSRTGKGTGLGLFISHQIIDQHGGTIEAASPGTGFGSTFTVRVPLTEVKTQDPGDRPESAEPATLPFPGSRAAA